MKSVPVRVAHVLTLASVLRRAVDLSVFVDLSGKVS